MSIDTGSKSVTPDVAWSAFSPSPHRRFALNGATMGTRYSAIFFAGAGVEVTAIHRALQAAVDLVDHEMSTWKPDSDLSRLNGAAVLEWVEVPKDLMNVLSLSMEIGQMSQGAFDVGVGGLVNAWGFGPSGAQPHAAPALPTNRRTSAMRLLEIDIDTNRVRKSAPVCIDLSGIAKGFGVDQLARCLDGFGIGDYLVSIDGEMRARGRKPDNAPWIVAVERPDSAARDITQLLELSDVAVATSGDYRHRVSHDGQEVSHTMDPRSGRPLANDVASVTVIAEDCVLADAWATALMVLGAFEGARLAEELGLDALFIIREKHGFRQVSLGRLHQG